MPSIKAVGRVIHKLGPAEVMDRLTRLINARIRLRKCDAVGSRILVTGRVKVRNAGTIRLGERTWIVGDIVPVELITHPGGTIDIGARVGIGYGTSIEAATSIKIGQDSIIAQYVKILDADLHNIYDKSWSTEGAPVTIGTRVWLGQRVIVLKGVTIGDNAVVTPNSVVTRDVPPNTVVTGNPARVIRRIDEPEQKPGARAAPLAADRSLRTSE